MNAEVTKKSPRLSGKVTAVEINLHERTTEPPFAMACYQKTRQSSHIHKESQEFRQEALTDAIIYISNSRSCYGLPTK